MVYLFLDYLVSTKLLNILILFVRLPNIHLYIYIFPDSKEELQKIMVSETGQIVDRSAKVFTKSVLEKRSESNATLKVLKKLINNHTIEAEKEIAEGDSIFQSRSDQSQPRNIHTSSAVTDLLNVPTTSANIDNESSASNEKTIHNFKKSVRVSQNKNETDDELENYDPPNNLKQTNTNESGYLILIPDGKKISILETFLFLTAIKFDSV